MKGKRIYSAKYEAKGSRDNSVRAEHTEICHAKPYYMLADKDILFIDPDQATACRDIKFTEHSEIRN